MSINKNNLAIKLCLLFLVLLCACEEKNEPLDLFSDVETLTEYEIMDLEQYDILDISDFFVHKNYYIIIHRRDELMLTLVDTNTGKFIKGLARGGGPDEFVSFEEIGVENGIFYINDNNNGKICEINLSQSIDSGKVIINYTTTPYRFMQVAANNNYIVGRSWDVEDPPARLSLYNRLSHELSFYYEFPKYLKDLAPNEKFLSEGQTHFKFRKGANDFIYYDVFGGVFSIWKIENNEIKLHKDFIFHVPEVYLKNYSALPKKENKNGFSSMYTSADYIFGSYVGKTQAEFQKDSYGTKHLLVFDWDGNPVKRYILSMGMIVACYNEGFIYGINFKEETKIIKYKLNIKH